MWRINDGSLGRIELDPWIGSGGMHSLSRDLILHLHAQGIKVLSHIAEQRNSDIFSQAWKSARQLDLPLQWHPEWHEYITALSEPHIRIKEGPDELVWSLAKNGTYAPKSGYSALILHKRPEQTMNSWSHICKLTASPHTRLFFWCVLRDIVPTGEHLTHRAFYGPIWCILCTCESESTEHLFLLCTALQSLWRILSTAIRFAGTWASNDLYSAWANWSGIHKGSKLQSLPLLDCWHIWQARNRFIFDNKAVCWPVDNKVVCWPRIEAGIISAYNELSEPNPPRERPPRERRTHPPPCIDKTTPWTFF